jgi:hypothetical protein
MRGVASWVHSRLTRFSGLSIREMGAVWRPGVRCRNPRQRPASFATGPHCLASVLMFGATFARTERSTTPRGYVQEHPTIEVRKATLGYGGFSPLISDGLYSVRSKKLGKIHGRRVQAMQDYSRYRGYTLPSCFIKLRAQMHIAGLSRGIYGTNRLRIATRLPMPQTADLFTYQCPSAPRH